jgi:hypothetical protein
MGPDPALGTSPDIPAARNSVNMNAGRSEGDRAMGDGLFTFFLIMGLISVGGISLTLLAIALDLIDV